jgi:hypothetical protein
MTVTREMCYVVEFCPHPVKDTFSPLKTLALAEIRCVGVAGNNSQNLVFLVIGWRRGPCLDFSLIAKYIFTF